MAVNTPNQGKSTGTGTTGPSASPQSFDTGSQPQKRSWSSNWAPGGISRTATSEVLVTAKKALQETITRLSPKGVSVKIIDLDRNQHSHLAFSSIILAISPDNGSQKVAIHTLLLAGSGSELSSYSEQYGNKPVVVPRYDQDAYDAVYFNTIKNTVIGLYPGFEPRNAAAQVVSRDFNWADQNLVYELVVISFQSLYKELFAGEGPSFSIPDFDTNQPLQATVSFGSLDHLVLNTPRRRDVNIRLQAINSSANMRDTPNVPDRESTILEVGGYLDFLWAPAAQQGNTNQFFSQANQATKKFAVRGIVTALDHINTNMSLEAALLGLFTFSLLGDGQQMLPYFMPRHSRDAKAFDGKDISALAIEANVANFDAKSASFTPADLGDFFDLTVHPGMAIAIDVDPVGPETAFTDIFSLALTDKTAGDMILEAANKLTGGAFDHFYQSNTSPVMPLDERVYAGTYTDGGGVVRDLREITNYLYVANFFKTNPANIAIWTDTILNESAPMIVRQEVQRGMIDTIIPSAKITGVMQRITFTHRFFDALAKGISQTGLRAKLVNSASGMEFRSMRGQASWINDALFSGGAASVFSHGANSGGARSFDRGFGAMNRSGW